VEVKAVVAMVKVKAKAKDIQSLATTLRKKEISAAYFYVEYPLGR
jgi:hypothetical protein